MNAGIFNKTQHLLIKFQLFVRMEPSLKQNLGSPQFLGFIYFLFKCLKRNDRAAAVFRALVKSTEFAGGNADVSIIYMSVNNLGDNRFRMYLFPDVVSQKSEIIEIPPAEQQQ